MQGSAWSNAHSTIDCSRQHPLTACTSISIVMEKLGHSLRLSGERDDSGRRKVSRTKLCFGSYVDMVFVNCDIIHDIPLHTRVVVVSPSTKELPVMLPQDLDAGSVSLISVPAPVPEHSAANNGGEAMNNANKHETLLVAKYKDDRSLLIVRIFMKLPAGTEVNLVNVPLDMVFPHKTLMAADEAAYSIAREPYIDDAYVKRPALRFYSPTSRPATLVCREAETCELLKRHPHPNIAEYRGVVVHNGCGRIVGLCFKKYQPLLCSVGVIQMRHWM